jgi:hypothetical protein
LKLKSYGLRSRLVALNATDLLNGFSDLVPAKLRVEISTSNVKSVVEMNPVAQIVGIDDQGDKYKAIQLWCPGCEITDPDGRKHAGLNMLPVEGDPEKRPTWQWNGDLMNVGLEPSILTKSKRGEDEFVCHSFLRNGRWQFLGDCTHALANQTVPMLPLPDWIVRESS